MSPILRSSLSSYEPHFEILTMKLNYFYRKPDSLYGGLINTAESKSGLIFELLFTVTLAIFVKNLQKSSQNQWVR